MSPENARARAQLIARIRAFFDRLQVLEVETPSLALGIAPDRHLEPFRVATDDDGRAACERLLITSPELHMKRLLAEGYPDIYQICHAFRKGECGRLHNPEFTMLEWYRRGFSMQGLMAEVAELCHAAAGPRPVVQHWYCDIFQDVVGIDPLSASFSQIHDTCVRLGAPPPSVESMTDLLQYAMAQLIEPRLPAGALVFIHHFPAAQAMLALLDPLDPRLAMRFELYCDGFELANGWEELVDSRENRARFDEQNGSRRAAGLAEVPLDKRFLGALEKGIPPCAGVALGVDRLVMLALGTRQMGEVRAFPWDES